MSAFYPPLDLPWAAIWRDAYVSALQIGTPEALEMANSIGSCVLRGHYNMQHLPSPAEQREDGALKKWLQQPAEQLVEWDDGPTSAALDETAMFEDEDIGVHHSHSAPQTAAASLPTSYTTNHTQHRLSFPAAAQLSSDSFAAAPSSVPFVSKRRAIQFSNPHPDQLEGDRIEPDGQSDELDDDIDFTPRDDSAQQPHRTAAALARRQSQGRASRRHPTPEHSPHCQPLERSVNKPFVCIYPYTVSGRRVDGGGEGQQEGGDGGGGGGGGDERNRCGQEFSTRQACENHIRSRHTLEKLKCSFPNCGYSSTDIQNLNKHERTHVRSSTVLKQPLVVEGALRMMSV